MMAGGGDKGRLHVPASPDWQCLAPTNEAMMIHVPAGPFLMGTSDQQVDRLARSDDLAQRWREKGHFRREQPQHVVTLADYYVARFPVTVGAYRALVEKRLDGVMVSVSGQLDLNYVPFNQLVDPATLVTVVRYIEPGSDFHRLARFLETYVHD